MLGGLFCAALVTSVNYCSGPYCGGRLTYDIFFMKNTLNSSGANVGLWVLAAVGFVVAIASGSLKRVRPLLARWLARAGAGLAVFALITQRLAVHVGDGISGKKLEMRDIALVGAVLLLVGCWRGLTPSKRTVLWLLLPGLAVVAIVAAMHLSRRFLLLVGAGGGGLLVGISLIAAGAAVEFRRREVSGRPPPGPS